MPRVLCSTLVSQLRKYTQTWCCCVITDSQTELSLAQQEEVKHHLLACDNPDIPYLPTMAAFLFFSNASTSGMLISPSVWGTNPRSYLVAGPQKVHGYLHPAGA